MCRCIGCDVTVGGGVGRCEFVNESFFLGSSGQIGHGTGGALTPLSTRERERERVKQERVRYMGVGGRRGVLRGVRGKG